MAPKPFDGPSNHTQKLQRTPTGPSEETDSRLFQDNPLCVLCELGGCFPARKSDLGAGLRPFVGMWFQVLFTPLMGVLFTVQSPY